MFNFIKSSVTVLVISFVVFIIIQNKKYLYKFKTVLFSVNKKVKNS